METASLTLITSPENHLCKHDVTPAEALILHKMHFRLANGSPLKDVSVTGKAKTIEVPAKNEVPEYFNPNIGKTIPAIPAVNEQSHARTSAEEVARLKRAYTGNIKGEDGRSLPAFVATFGTAVMMQLPQTFAEIEGELKLQGQIKYPAVEAKPKSSKEMLFEKTRSELCAVAAELGVEVAKNDSKEKIADAILEAQTIAAEAAS